MDWQVSVSNVVVREQSDELRAERAAILAKWSTRDKISSSDARAVRAVIAAALRNPEERMFATTSLPRKAAGEDPALDAQRTARASALMTVRDLYKALLRYVYGPRKATAGELRRARCGGGRAAGRATLACPVPTE